jgi:hypothetical protein
VLDLTADGSSTVMQVTGPDGDDRIDGCPATRDRTITVPVALDEPGAYAVTWRVVSADGHPTSGEFSFSYAPEGGEPEAGDSAAPAGCDRASDTTSDGAPDADTPEDTGDTADTGDSADTAAPEREPSGCSDLPVVLGIAGGVVVLAGAGVLLALRLARRRGD